MIVFSQQSGADLEDCLDALMFPKYKNRPPLTFEEAHDYVDEIVEFVYSISEKATHTNCIFDTHKKYGEKVVRYERNKYTQYYIIYNVDVAGNIYVERIMTNHITTF
jgi:hypothetical protein